MEPLWSPVHLKLECPGSAPTRSPSAGGTVAADLHTGVGCLGRHKLVLACLTVSGEQRLAAAERDGLDHEHELVHQVGSKESPNQRQAAVDVNVTVRLVAQRRHLLQQVGAP